MAQQMEEMSQILVTNNLKLPANRVYEASSEVLVIGRDIIARDDPKGKKVCSRRDEVESHGDNRTEVLVKHKDPPSPPSRSISGVDLHHALNAKRNKKEVDLQAKLAAK